MKIRKPKAGKGWIAMSINLQSIPVPHIPFQHSSGITVISDVVETQRGLEQHLSITKKVNFHQ